MVEEELGLGAFADASKAPMSIDLGKMKEALAITLQEEDDLSKADKTGHSKRTGAKRGRPAELRQIVHRTRWQKL